VEQRKYGQAARILGAIEQVLITSTPNLPTTPAEYKRSVVTVRGHLGEEGFTAAWSEGQAMSLEQAVAYALADHAASNA
jgi:hypothetical protein